MVRQLTFIGVASVMSMAGLVSASAGTLTGDEWSEFLGTTPAASFAWAGVDEGCWRLASRDPLGRASSESLRLVDEDSDVEFLTGLAAPEPPTWLLAGLGFGVVMCGRSLYGKRSAA